MPNMSYGLQAQSTPTALGPGSVSVGGNLAASQSPFFQPQPLLGAMAGLAYCRCMLCSTLEHCRRP